MFILTDGNRAYSKLTVVELSHNLIVLEAETGFFYENTAFERFNTGKKPGFFGIYA